MSDLRAAAQQALEALEQMVAMCWSPKFTRREYDSDEPEQNELRDRVLGSITDLKSALTQPEQEPVTWGVDWGRNGDQSCCTIIKRHADGVQEVVAVEYGPPRREPEQEPVAWSTRERFYEALNRAVENVRQEMRIKTVTMRRKDHDVALPIIAASFGNVLVGDPPRREWASLTDEEIQTIVNKVATGTYQTSDTFARAVEQACKERNNG